MCQIKYNKDFLPLRTANVIKSHLVVRVAAEIEQNV